MGIGRELGVAVEEEEFTHDLDVFWKRCFDYHVTNQMCAGLPV